MIPLLPCHTSWPSQTELEHERNHGVASVSLWQNPACFIREKRERFSTLVSRHERKYVEEGCRGDDWVRGTPALALVDIGRNERGMRDKVAADGQYWSLLVLYKDKLSSHIQATKTKRKPFLSSTFLKRQKST